MELAISHQITEAAVALALGVAAGVLYDAFRVIRSHLRAAYVTLTADVLFGLLFGVALFLAGLTIGRGMQRIFMVVLAICGGTLYFCTVSRFVLMLLGMAAKAVSFILYCLSLPFVWAYMLFKKIYVFFKNIFQKLSKRCIIKHHGVKDALFRRMRHRKALKEVAVHETETGRSFYENTDNGFSCVRGNYAYKPVFQNRNS